MRKFFIALAVALTLPAVSEAGCKRTGVIAQIKQNVQDRRELRQVASGSKNCTVVGHLPIQPLKTIFGAPCATGKCSLGTIK